MACYHLVGKKGKRGRKEREMERETEQTWRGNIPPLFSHPFLSSGRLYRLSALEGGEVLATLIIEPVNCDDFSPLSFSPRKEVKDLFALSWNCEWEQQLCMKGPLSDFCREEEERGGGRGQLYILTFFCPLLFPDS